MQAFKKKKKKHLIFPEDIGLGDLKLGRCPAATLSAVRKSRQQLAGSLLGPELTTVNLSKSQRNNGFKPITHRLTIIATINNEEKKTSVGFLKKTKKTDLFLSQLMLVE